MPTYIRPITTIALRDYRDSSPAICHVGDRTAADGVFLVTLTYTIGESVSALGGGRHALIERSDKGKGWPTILENWIERIFSYADFHGSLPGLGRCKKSAPVILQVRSASRGASEIRLMNSDGEWSDWRPTAPVILQVLADLGPLSLPNWKDFPARAPAVPGE